MNGRKKGIIPPIQLALLSGIAGHLINSIIEKVEYNSEIERSRSAALDPNGTVVRKRKGSDRAELVDVDDVAETFVEENCPYIAPAGKDNSRYYITQSINIGRYPHNDVQVQDETVSRVHCRIFVKNGKYYLVDMGAATPAKLNGTPVDNSKPRSRDELYSFELSDGDRITIGRTEYVFRRSSVADRGYHETLNRCDSTVLLD